MISILIVMQLPPQAPFVSLEAPKRVEMRLSKSVTQRVPLRVVNRSKENVIVYSADFWSNHSIRLTDLKGREVPRTPFGERVVKEFPNNKRGRNIPITIPAGKERQYNTPDFASAFNLSAGEYKLTVVYKDMANHPRDPSREVMELNSNPVLINIVP